ncbi:MAG: leucine-rich repeat domain-containing protein, partial [Promethearchaeota archaeon]
MARKPEKYELLEKFKKIMKVTQRINKSEVARYLGISEFELVSFIADLGDELPVKIDVDYIVVDDFNSFVDYTDQLFSTWAEMETAKTGKLNTPPKTGPKPAPSMQGTTPTTTAVGIASSPSATPVQEPPAPEWRKKYDFNLKLGNAAIKDGKLDVALARFKSALDVAEENYDADLTLEAGRLVEQVEKLKAEREQQEKIRIVQAKLDSARASFDSGNLASALAGFKAVKSECERLGYRDGMQAANDYIAKIEAKLPKDYHGTKLVANEYNVMVELERLTGEPIPQLSNVYDKTFGVIAENGHIVQLGLYNKGLTSLPENIGNLIKLQEFYLDKNKLSTIPSSIGNLHHLKKLSLWNNQLTSL